MKKFIYLLFFSVSALYTLTSTRTFPDNPPEASTGAPGEQTCASAGCHSNPNSSLAGSIDISGLPTEIEPSKTYQITVKASSATGKSTGFQLTCLDGANNKCGTFATVAGVSIGLQNNRDYPRNSKSAKYTGGAMSWTFPWTAPATLTNKNITFYAASVVGNGNGNEVGDNVVTTVEGTTLKTTPTIDAVLDAAVKIFPNPVSDFLNIELVGYEQAEAFLFDANGRQIKKMYLSATNNINVKDIEKGNYLLQIKADNKQTIRKILFQ